MTPDFCVLKTQIHKIASSILMSSMCVDCHWRTILRHFRFIHSFMLFLFSPSLTFPLFFQGYPETCHSFNHAWGSSTRLAALWRDINVSGQTEARDIWLELSWTGTQGQVSVIQLNPHILTTLKENSYQMRPTKGAFMCTHDLSTPNLLRNANIKCRGNSNLPIW